MTRGALALLAVPLLVATAPAAAGPADVVDANARCRGDVCTVWASVLHRDEGWDHYADAFEVLDEDGKVLAVRRMLHPHTDEQPFRRAVQGVKLPPGTTRLRVRARDTVHGVVGREFVIELAAGED